MANQKIVLLSFFLVFLVHQVAANAPCSKDLKLSYYQNSCPDVEKIVKQVTQQFISQDPSLAAALLRINFHDCIVRGCDASLLLKPTKTNNQTELTATPNLTLRGLNVIDSIKAELEKKCPGTISCADIIPLASRDAVNMVHGPWWEVPMGRRDGRVSMVSEALANIPSPFANITTLKQNFAAKGLNARDLVVLSGGHTLGIGHCFIILQRLYNFTGKGDTDPSLDPHFASWLKTICKPRPNDLKTVVAQDPTPTTFDLKYFDAVAKHRGIFQSDAALLDDKETRNYMMFQLGSSNPTFATDFATSMVKMNQIGVLTGTQGEIRKNCGFVN